MRTYQAPLAAGVAVALLGACHASGPRAREPVARPLHAATPQRGPMARPVSDLTVRRRVLLGYSVAGRPITAEEIGDADSPRRALVVGCIHGDEAAGIAIARALSASPALREVDLWIVPDLNPDGVARGSRANAAGVDLNRNFPDRWRPLGPQGSAHFAGTGPLSEPESRLAARLLRRLRPAFGIWYHQALDVVDDSQGPLVLERRYAFDTGMALSRLTDYPGSATGYEDALFGPTAFVVELPGGRLSAGQVRRHVLALRDIAARVGRGAQEPS